MSKILEQKGFKYSREKFEGYKFRTSFRFSVSEDWREDTKTTIYTDNPNIEEVFEVINSRTGEDIIKSFMEHWTTKEQDDLATLFIEETLKDL